MGWNIEGNVSIRFNFWNNDSREEKDLFKDVMLLKAELST